MNLKIYFTTSVLLVTAISGCIFIDSPDDSFERLDFFGDINEGSEGELRLDGNIAPREWNNNIRINDLSVIGYGSRGNVMFIENLGEYYTNESIRFNITHPRRPKYIIFSSPDIWNRNDVSIQYLVRYPQGHYSQNWTNTGERLPDVVRDDIINN